MSTGTLKPGEYAQVTFHISSHGNVLRLPASALTFRQQGLQVATVLPDSHVQMKPIVIGRDLGTQVEVSEGLNPQDRIVDNPPDSIKSGDVVHVQASGRAHERQRSEQWQQCVTENTSILAGAAFVLAGCSLAPDYKVPATPAVQAFKEAGIWTKATPEDSLPKGAWWTIYGDSTLTGLEAKIDTSIPRWPSALARYNQANAYVAEAEGSTFPRSARL